MDAAPPTPPQRLPGRVWEVFFAAARLGLTSFGGPTAHLGYFREEYVERRRWLSEAAYADLVALGQMLPGPASSQVGMAIGIHRAGLLGGLAAWFGFTAPSAVALILFAIGVGAAGDLGDAGWLRGLKGVAVAVVALALWGMARNLAPDRPRQTIALGGALVVVFVGGALAQFAVIAAGALAGVLLLRAAANEDAPRSDSGVPKPLGAAALLLFAALLVGLPLAARAVDSEPLGVFSAFYRAGSLVFGGGHVVLPLLEAEVTSPGWVGLDEFVAGYGAAQAVPGPLFTFAAYLGAVMETLGGVWTGGLFTLTAIFLPSFLLVVGVLPFWEALRVHANVRAALRGVNAAVVGLLLAALYDPVWTSAVKAPGDFAVVVGAFGLLAFWRAPPWLVVPLAAVAGTAIAAL